MPVIEAEQERARTISGAQLLVAKKDDHNITYLIAIAVISLNSLMCLTVLIIWGNVAAFLPWLSVLALTSVIYGGKLAARLFAGQSYEKPDSSRITEAIAATYFTFLLLLTVLIAWQNFQWKPPVVMSRQVVEIQLCSPNDYQDQKQLLPSTVPKESVRRRRSADRITRSGAAHAVTAPKKVPLKDKPVVMKAVSGNDSQSKSPEKFVPSGNWKTVNIAGFKSSPVSIQDKRHFMEEVAAPELVELLNNDGDNSVHLWQDGGSSNSGAGKDNQLVEYLKVLNRMIKMRWSPPRGKTRSAQILFRIRRDGHLAMIKLISSSGDELADAAALKAVSSAAPFQKLPADYTLPFIDIQYGFNYSVDELQEVNRITPR